MAEDLSTKNTLFKKSMPDLTGPIRPVGVGLTEGEFKALEAIGAELGELLDTDPVAKNAIMRLAIGQFILAYYGGQITPEDLAAEFAVPPKRKAKLKPRT